MSPNDRQLITMQTQMYRRVQQSNQSVIILEDIWTVLFSWYYNTGFIHTKCLNLNVCGIALSLQW
jgi:hypothetical protein